MKSLSESLFDGDLIKKELVLGQFFNVSVRRYKGRSRTDDDERTAKEIENDVTSIDLKTLNPINWERLTNKLNEISKRYVKNWRGGTYQYTIYDKSNHKITPNKIINLLDDVSDIIINMEDWNNYHTSFYTHYILTRK